MELFLVKLQGSLEFYCGKTPSQVYPVNSDKFFIVQKLEK